MSMEDVWSPQDTNMLGLNDIQRLDERRKVRSFTTALRLQMCGNTLWNLYVTISISYVCAAVFDGAHRY